MEAVTRLRALSMDGIDWDPFKDEPPPDWVQPDMIVGRAPNGDLYSIEPLLRGYEGFSVWYGWGFFPVCNTPLHCPDAPSIEVAKAYATGHAAAVHYKQTFL